MITLHCGVDDIGIDLLCFFLQYEFECFFGDTDLDHYLTVLAHMHSNTSSM